MTNSLEIPLYANKPQRKVAGLKNVVAVTMYKSHDGTVAQYALFTADGEASLGTAYFQPKRMIWPRGYAMSQSPRIDAERWNTLAEFAIEMGKRLDVEIEEA